MREHRPLRKRWKRWRNWKWGNYPASWLTKDRIKHIRDYFLKEKQIAICPVCGLKTDWWPLWHDDIHTAGWWDCPQCDSELATLIGRDDPEWYE